MQKLLDFIRKSIIGRSFLYVFISNFFCMQCFGMLFVEQPLHTSNHQERQLFLCDSPSATVGLEFLGDDFNLSFEAGDTSKAFSKQNTLFRDGLYHINLSDKIEVAIDSVARKIFCYKFLWDESVLFSAFGGSVIVNELICGGLTRLAADNICVSGMLSSSAGLTLTAQKAIENVGVIDSPPITTNSDVLVNLGRMNGKFLDLNARLFAFSLSIFANGDAQNIAGTIESETDILIESLKSFRERKEIKRSFSNKGGTIKAVGEVSFLSPTIDIGGDIIAGTLIYRYYQPSSEKEYAFVNIANLQKGQTAEFKGVVARVGGDLKVENGTLKLTPIMVNEISTKENGNYRVHHPSAFVASGINTFRAPQISMTNPLLSATASSSRNRKDAIDSARYTRLDQTYWW